MRNGSRNAHEKAMTVKEKPSHKRLSPHCAHCRGCSTDGDGLTCDRGHIASDQAAKTCVDFSDARKNLDPNYSKVQ